MLKAKKKHVSVNALERQVARLKRALATLTADLAVTVDTPSDWRLSPMERALFGCLLRNKVVTKRMARAALYGPTSERDYRTIIVFISRLRAKTRKFGVEIESIRGTGFRLVNRAGWAARLKAESVGRK